MGTVGKKKKPKLKPNQFDLGNGFILELVKHPLGDVNGDLEGFLQYQNIDVELLPEYKRFYSENTEAINDFERRIIPDYIAVNKIKVFKYLDNDHMFNFTKEYLLNNKVCYGQVLDIIKILEDDGYEIPSNTDKVQVGNLLDFYSCVNRLSKEFKSHLIIFGYTADRDVNNKTDHSKFTKHEKCRNIVFTRYPWSNGYKAINAINDFVVFTDNDLSLEVDMKTFKKHSSDCHKHLESVFKVFNKTNLMTKEVLDKISFKETRDDFRNYIKENRTELVKFWSKRQADNYGVYPRV